MLLKTVSRYNFITYLLTTMSAITWALSMIMSDLNIGDFGLIQSISPLFFVSLGLLLTSFILALNIKSRELLSTIILLLIMFLFLTPAIIEDTPRFRSSYKVYGFTDYIVQHGYINPSDIWYHNWPGAFISMSILLNMTDSSNNLLFWLYFPFIIQILYFFPIYTILNTLFQNDEKKKWIGIWVFYILNYTNQDYVSPQAMAYLFFLIILSFVAKMIVNRDLVDTTYNVPYKFIGIILFSSLVITHMITSMLIILIFILTTIFMSNSIYKKICYQFTFLYAIILTVWIIYGAYRYLDWHLVEFFSKAFDIDLLFSQNIENRVAGSSAHLVISRLMIYSAIISGIMAIIGIVLSYYKKDKIYSVNKMMIIVAGATLLLAPISSYGGEMIMRLFLFSLPLMAFFIPQVCNKKFSIMLILFLVIMTPVHILTHYGNERYDYLSVGELIFYNFFYDKTNTQYYITGTIIGDPVAAYKYPDRYKYFDYKNLEWNGEKYVLRAKNFGEINYYAIIISRGDAERFKRFFNNTNYISDFEKRILDSRDHKAIYSNGYTNLYIKNGGYNTN